MIGIYKITNPKGRIYVGQTVNDRNRKYKYKSIAKTKNRVHCGPKLFYSLIKYGWEQHKFEIIEECSIELLNQNETKWKQFYLDKANGDWKKVLFCELYDNGGGPRSQEVKDKISKSNKGRIVSEETKLKKNKSLTGQKRTEETKHKMSIAAKGKPKSKKHIKNMMKNRQGVIKATKIANSKPVLQYDLNMNFIKEWFSITEAKSKCGGDINSVISGKQKTAGGFIWKLK